MFLISIWIRLTLCNKFDTTRELMIKMWNLGSLMLSNSLHRKRQDFFPLIQDLIFLMYKFIKNLCLKLTSWIWNFMIKVWFELSCLFCCVSISSCVCFLLQFSFAESFVFFFIFKQSVVLKSQTFWVYLASASFFLPIPEINWSCYQTKIQHLIN